MPYNLDLNLEYFLGVRLGKRETQFFATLRQELEQTTTLSSPPHVTIKPPFVYHFEKPLIEQLAKWAKQQQPFMMTFEKIGTFKHRKYATVFYPQRKLVNSVSLSKVCLRRSGFCRKKLILCPI